MRISDGKIAFSGFEKAEKEFYYTPSVSVASRTPLTAASADSTPGLGLDSGVVSGD